MPQQVVAATCFAGLTALASWQCLSSTTGPSPYEIGVASAPTTGFSWNPTHPQTDPFLRQIPDFQSSPFFSTHRTNYPLVENPLPLEDEPNMCMLGPEGFPPPVRCAAVMRGGKIDYASAEELAAEGSPFLIEFYDNDFITRSTIGSFNELMEQFPEDRDALTTLLKKLHEEVSEVKLTGGNVEDLKSFNELYGYGIKLRQKIDADESELPRLTSKKDGLKTSEIALSIASGGPGPGVVSVHFGNKISQIASEQTALESQIRAQEERIKEGKAVRKELVDLFTDLLRNLHPARTADDRAIAWGTAGAIAEGLGDTEWARIHYTSASWTASHNNESKDNNPLLADYFSLQSIRLMSEEGDEAWKSKVRELNAFMAEARSQASSATSMLDMRDGPSLQYAGAERVEGAFRALMAEALMLKVGLYSKNDMESDDDEYEALMKAVLSQMEAATQRPASQREAKYLSLALAGLEDIRVKEAAEESRIGDLDKVHEFAPIIDQDVYVAEKMYEAHGFKDDGFAALLNTAYYSLYQQSGLPIDAVYTWFQNAFSAHKDCDAVQKQASLIKERAPHLFDGVILKARRDITPPANAEEARELEANLHITSGTTFENFAIGGTASVAGSWIGAKTFASAGVMCGPYAEVCVPVGGVIGGVAGFFGGNEIINVLHADEVENMETQAQFAGVDLLRITREESQLAASAQYFGLGLGAVTSGAFGGWATKAATPWGLRGAWEFLSEEGSRGVAKWVGDRGAYIGREIMYEVRHTGNYFKGIYWAARGVVSKTPPPGFDKFVRPKLDEAFELIYARMSPGQQAQMPKAQWRTAFDNMVEYGDTVLFRPTSAGPKPLPVSWFDRTSGLKWLDDFAKGRVDAMRFAVSENVPEFAQSRLALMGRKELERQAFRESQGFDRALADKFAADAATKKAAALAKKGYLGKAIDIAFGPKTQKLYRLGMLAAAADYAFVKDTPEGYELTPWDGHIDTGWGAAGYIAGTGYYSTRLGINTYNGSINGGGMKAVTFVGFQGLAGLALFDSDIKKIAGAQDEYLVVLPATLLLYSGMHAKGGKSTILNAVSQLPFVRRIPSLSAYTSAYGAHSTIGSPSFIRTTPGFIPNNFKGMAVSLGYTIPFIMGVTAYTGGTLLSSDPYFIGQRGWKFFFVGTILNPIQIALGGDTGRAQSATRLLGLITDLLPAVSLSPYYNNSYNMRRTLLRMAGEKGPDDVDEELRLFVSEPDNWMSYVGLNGMSTVNRTFDLGGFIGRDAFEIAKPNTWNFGWRWEPDGVNAWLNAMEGYKDKKRGWIEGAGTTHPELYADMAFSFYKGFENPEFWMGTEHRTRGMLIYSIVAKWYAQRFKNGEQQFAPYANLLDQAPEQWRTGFWDRVPQVGNREELLRQVAVVQEMPIDEVEALMAASYKIDIGADK